MAKILITGGTGLVGSHLQKQLILKGHHPILLSRAKEKPSPYIFYWDIKKEYIDPAALADTEVIIHLAGSGIADKRWTDSYKRELADSRIKSAALLFKTLKSSPNKVHTFISASASGYYGNTGDQWADELYPCASDFLGHLCHQWEKAATQFSTTGIRCVMIRTGIVLSKNGGALNEFAKQVRLFAGAPLGSGRQYIPWIHPDDISGIYIHAVENKNISGAYNASAPDPVQNSFFMKTLARIFYRPFWPLNIPGAVLKLILGEKARIVLEGQRMNSQKIREAGYKFRFTELNDALAEIYK